MTVRPATSTARPLSRKREQVKTRTWLSLSSANANETANDNGRGRASATLVQTKEAPRMRRKAIQTKKSESDFRLATLAQIDTMRVEIRKLVDVIALGADIELLDVMRDEAGSYSRHKAAQEAHTWAGAAGVRRKTGLMMPDRAMPPKQTEQQQ